MTTVVLYGRAGLLPVRRRAGGARASPSAAPIRARERDIEADDALLRAYLERIPVVTIDGQRAFELFVDESEFERRLDMVHTR